MKGSRRNSASTLRQVLESRAAMERAVRDFFDSEGFLEVTTPAALPCPNLDPNIAPVPVTIRDFSGDPSRHWLHTSPELAMKKLVSRGAGSIYQIAQVFRDEEHTSLHRCEFSMLEWYRTEADYENAIRDTMLLTRAAAAAVTGSEEVVWGETMFDLAAEWEELTMAEAFRLYAGVDSIARDDLSDALADLGYRVAADDRLEDLFFALYLEVVEPNLGMERPTIIRDYPAFLGTMAMPREDNPDVLERFEIYIGGMELANGFTELSDQEELARRMEGVLRDLAEAGVEGLAIDEEFIEAMANLPPCAGVSVGLDRLLMLLLDVVDIGQVVFPFAETTI
ncbi:MAG: EF-P lysine aminoacylase EpmA [bacterium]|nr:EF-P lysine aminoacylase EpmA [bacterium]